MASLTSFTDEARIALDTIAGRAAEFFLSVVQAWRHRSVACRQDCVHHRPRAQFDPWRTPALFEAHKSGRISRALLEQQPDDAVPRFQYEDHVAALIDARIWPDSTRAISELRLTIEYELASGWNRLFSSGRLAIDIVDYPGEWLLDLPLLGSIPRVQYLRVIIMELARITDHLVCNAVIGVDTGALTGFVYLFQQRELVYEIYEEICGARLTTNIGRIGGFESDFSPKAWAKIHQFLKEFPSCTERI